MHDMSAELSVPRKMTKSYCNLMSLAQYEEQAATETEKALESLMDYLDSNPKVYQQMLKKKKKYELENAGFISYLKVKMDEFLHGENSRLLNVNEAECEEKLAQMKNDMTTTFEHSQEVRGRRISKRLAERKRKQKQQLTQIKENVPSAACMPPPPPPPLPPLVPTMGTKVSCQSTPHRRTALQEKSHENSPVQKTPLRDSGNTVMNTPQSLQKPTNLERTSSLLSLGTLPPMGSLSSLHDELMSTNPMKRLRSTNTERSPGGTPVLKRRPLHSPCSYANSPAVTEPLYRALMKGMQEKFRNARSPSPSEENGSPSSVVSPGFTP